MNMNGYVNDDNDDIERVSGLSIIWQRWGGYGG